MIDIYISTFNDNEDSSTYVGYMYGDASVPDLDTYYGYDYDVLHANVNNSTIKSVLDTWYQNNFSKTEYESYLGDSIFCNDRSIYSTSKYNVYYGAYYRLNLNRLPQLTCNQQHDAFTVSDTTYGNGDLTYPIGLITADEMALAGAVLGTSNSSYYLYTGSYYWTMSPDFFYGEDFESSNILIVDGEYDNSSQLLLRRQIRH